MATEAMTGHEEDGSDRRHPELEMASREEGRGEVIDRVVEKIYTNRMELSSLETTTQRTFGRLRLTGVNKQYVAIADLSGTLIAKAGLAARKNNFL